MDEALKARLIGAAVLVALAVLLIPELLSGGKSGTAEDAAATASPGTRTFTIDLPGSKPESVPATRSMPGPATGDTSAQPKIDAKASGSGTTAPGGAPAVQAGSRTAEQTPGHDAGAPASAPSRSAAVATAPPPPAPRTAAGAAGGGWAVQVGAFSTTAKADKLAAELKSAGYQAYVSPVSRAGKTLQRVRVGPEADRSGADRLAARLKARGLPATVVSGD